MRQQAGFTPISLPELDSGAISELLQRGLGDLDARAAAQVQAHLGHLGAGGERWIADGMNGCNRQQLQPAGMSARFACRTLADQRSYPITGRISARVTKQLKQGIADKFARLTTAHSGEVMAAFERSVRVAIELRQFWSQFAELPEVKLDTAAVARGWKAALEPLLAALRAKRTAPLECVALPPETAPHSRLT